MAIASAPFIAVTCQTWPSGSNDTVAGRWPSAAVISGLSHTTRPANVLTLRWYPSAPTTAAQRKVSTCPEKAPSAGSSNVTTPGAGAGGVAEAEAGAAVLGAAPWEQATVRSVVMAAAEATALRRRRYEVGVFNTKEL